MLPKEYWVEKNEMIDWKGLTINIYSEVTQLKSVPKLHANTSSPDVYCWTSFELAAPYGNNATVNPTPKRPDTMLVRVI